MAFIERYDMPRQMLGITGLNPWNILMLFVLLGCLANAKREQLTWDFPKPMGRLLFLFLIVVLIGFARLAADFDQIRDFFVMVNRAPKGVVAFVIDDLLNSVKYAVPGMLMFFGCNSRHRMIYGIAACLLTSFLLGIQIIKWMPIGDLANADLLSDRALRVLDRAIGYHRVDLAALMASASWGFFVARGLVPGKFYSWMLTGAGVILILALALTGGRTGYGTWLVLASLFTVLKWKRLVFFIPVALMIVIAVVPAARDRMLVGFEQEPDDSGMVFEQEGANLERITSDRVLIWAIVIDRIKKAPLIGYGRQGHFLSGAGAEMRETYGERKAFPHPHNAYLELLLDNGLIGAMPIFMFFFFVCLYSKRLFKVQNSQLLNACGGLGLALVVGQLIASIGGQSFYPRAGVVIMWCAIGLAMRAYVFLQNSEAGIGSDDIWDKPPASPASLRRNVV
jgi:O-antigen ligase